MIVFLVAVIQIGGSRGAEVDLLILIEIFAADILTGYTDPVAIVSGQSCSGLPQTAVVIQWRTIFVISGIHHTGQTEVFKIAQTIAGSGAFARGRKCGQQHRRQNGDNGDDNEEFNEGEAQLHPTMVG